MHEGEITLKMLVIIGLFSTTPKRTFGLFLPLIMFSTIQQTFGLGRKRKTGEWMNKHRLHGLTTAGTISVWQHHWTLHKKGTSFLSELTIQRLNFLYHPRQQGNGNYSLSQRREIRCEWEREMLSHHPFIEPTARHFYHWIAVVLLFWLPWSSPGPIFQSTVWEKAKRIIVRRFWYDDFGICCVPLKDKNTWVFLYFDILWYDS